jgi:hypothetical protein
LKLSSADDSIMLDSLRNAFARSGNLKASNEAMYWRRVSERNKAGYSRLANDASHLFWGYGLRPVRVFAWLIVLNVLFGLAYWSQTSSEQLGGWSRRITAVTAFTLRSSWRLTWGFDHARTPVFKAITLVHSVASKILLVCLLHAMSNTSPLLNELLGRVLTL